MKTIGIIGAMEVEVAILKEKMEDVRIIKKLPWIFMREYLLEKGCCSAFRNWQGKCWYLCSDSGRCIFSRCDH